MEKAVRSLSSQGSMRQKSELALNELSKILLPLMFDERKKNITKGDLVSGKSA